MDVSGLTVIDLFSGAGGMSEGFRRAGFSSLLAIDNDEMAATTFKHNHPEVPFLIADIQKVSNKQILEIAGVHPGQVTVVCGGPPCQGFSLAGQRLSDDPRNQLVKEFVRVVEAVEPMFFVLENVSGIASMQRGAVVSALLESFEHLGYAVSTDVLNAADYGVPQSRPRFIMIGSRTEKRTGMPPKTHGIVNNQLTFSFELTEPLKPHINVWDAIGDLPHIRQGEGAEELVHDAPYDHPYQLDRRGHRQPGMVYNHRATSHSERIQVRYAAFSEGGDVSTLPAELRTKKNNVFRLDRFKPARTVTCNHRTDLLHPLLPRGTTVREAARLQSFDDDYRFFGNLTRKAKWTTQDDQVGNAVPPLLAEAIAKHLVSMSLPVEVHSCPTRQLTDLVPQVTG